MAKAKSAISLGVVSLVVIAIILIVGFGVFLSTILNTGTTSTSSGSNSSTQSTTPATSTSIMPTQSSSNSLSGLRLDLFVAPSNLSYGEVINVDEYNALNSLNNVRNNNEFQYPANSLNPYDPCGLIGPVGFAVFQGYFDLSNYTTATALRLYNETGDTCITTVSVQDSYYSFQPRSDLATLVYPSGTFADTNTTVAMSFTEIYLTTYLE